MDVTSPSTLLCVVKIFSALLPHPKKTKQMLNIKSVKIIRFIINHHTYSKVSSLSYKSLGNSGCSL